MFRKTSIIILTHNQLKYTKICIKSIRKYTEKYELIVVDNASADLTPQWLKAQEDIKVVLNETNKGFAAGCNQGIKEASGTEILLLNNDTIVMPNWLDNLRTALYSSDEIGAVGPVSNSCSNWQVIKVDYENNNLLRALEFGRKYNRFCDPAAWKKKVKLIGFCMLIKKSVVDMVGGLDERFFPGNFEDDDYSLRIIEAGYDLLQCNDTFIHHFGGTSFKAYDQKYADILLDNQKRFFDKWGINFISSTMNLEEYQHIELKPNARILEIGCACGASLLEIKAKFPDVSVYGIDKAPKAAKITSHYFPTVCGDIETMDLQYTENFFDYIVLPDLLSCVINPLSVLKKIKPYIKNDGYIIASCHNIMHYENIRKLLSGEWEYENSLLGNAFTQEHLRFFNLKSLSKLANMAGVVIKKCEALTRIPEDAEFNNSLVNQLLSVNLTPQEKVWELKVYRYVIHMQNH
ncbi:bifunctional glycosyltransferase family 2 protein/class I SAM-dependent methyltransferase [Pectinatus haikarae]|uniref:GT2 family glycosyltransferase n=1 Tax=Pectinatus haikarae TaxID=349096 RepID=A0ABT9YBC3_9FIRM|nr:bifunctional glycosyltransferase family 2 protein/class I SAM-dependent methyltransferase [Pectinatus haikarae]MDQ0205144.1 GT2 family glycosyltransferase [Pectinatus haikarae]